MQDLRWLVRQFEHSDEKVQIDTADLPRLAAVKTGRLGKAVERLCSLRPIVAADQADLCNEVWGLWQSSADAILMEPKHTSSDNGDPRSPQSRQQRKDSPQSRQQRRESTNKRAASSSPPSGSPQKDGGIQAWVDGNPKLTVGPEALESIHRNGLQFESTVQKKTEEKEETEDGRRSAISTSISSVHMNIQGKRRSDAYTVNVEVVGPDAVPAAAATHKPPAPEDSPGMRFVTCTWAVL